MSWTNYHSHTNYCDGENAAEDYVLAALQSDLAAYGFSSHCPVPFDSEWNMKVGKLQDYCDEIDQLKSEYDGQIELYKGLEVDYIPEVIGPKHPDILDADLDFTVGSVHFIHQFEDGRPWEIDGDHRAFQKGLKEIFGGDIQAVIRGYFNLTRRMIEEECPSIVGHLDKIKVQNVIGKYYSEEELFYQKAVLETLEVIRDSGVIVEINTRGKYQSKTNDFYPSDWVIRKMFDMDIPVQINSDSHRPEEITLEFKDVAQLLSSVGFKTVRVLLSNEWQDLPFDEKGILTPQASWL